MSVYAAVNVDVAWHVCFQLSSTPPSAELLPVWRARGAASVYALPRLRCICLLQDPAEHSLTPRTINIGDCWRRPWSWLLQPRWFRGARWSTDVSLPMAQRRKCKYSQFGPCIHTHCNIKLYVDGVCFVSGGQRRRYAPFACKWIIWGVPQWRKHPHRGFIWSLSLSFWNRMFCHVQCVYIRYIFMICCFQTA